MACVCRVESREWIQAAVLIQLLIINGAMFCVEAVAGILANSSALLADSIDMLADAAIYGIALYAVGRANSAKRRAALTSGIFQGVLGLFVAGDVIRRFVFGSEPASLAMIAIGAAALAANVACLWLLRKQRHGEIHIRASWIFTRTDTLANVGTILAGVLVLVTKNAVPDLIIGAIICLAVLAGCFEIVRTGDSTRTALLVPLYREARIEKRQRDSRRRHERSNSCRANGKTRRPGRRASKNPLRDSLAAKVLIDG